MATNYEFGRGLINGAEQKELVVRDLEQMVRFAAEPVKPGQTVTAQIRNASNALRLDYGTVRRCWYGLASTGVYPTVYNAWARLVQERSRQVATVYEFPERHVDLVSRARADLALSDSHPVRDPRKRRAV